MFRAVLSNGVHVKMNATAKRLLSPSCIASLESQQLDEESTVDEVHVLTPSEMGAMAIASATASAFGNPDNTAIAFLDENDGGCFTRAEVSAVKQLINTSKAAVFNDIKSLESYLEKRCKRT